MARRARSRSDKSQWALPAILLVAMVSGGWLLHRTLNFSGPEAGFAGVKELDVTEYLDNANSLRGNVFSVSGVIDDQLRWTASRGRLYSLKSGGYPLPIHIPHSFRGQNIGSGEEFVFKVEVRDGGLLVAQDLRKI